MNISVRNLDYMKELNAKTQALQSPVIHTAILNETQKLFPFFGEKVEDEILLGTYTVLIQVKLPLFFDIWSLPPEYLNCTEEEIQFSIYKTFHCPDYNNAQVQYNITCSVPLSEEDIETLKSLGKIKQEYSPGYYRTYLSCDT